MYSVIEYNDFGVSLDKIEKVETDKTEFVLVYFYENGKKQVRRLFFSESSKSDDIVCRCVYSNDINQYNFRIFKNLTFFLSGNTCFLNGTDQGCFMQYGNFNTRFFRSSFPISGIKGAVNCIEFDNNNNNIFIGTDQGCFKVEENSAEAKPIKGIEGKVTCVKVYNQDILFIGTNQGCFKLEEKINKCEKNFDMQQSEIRFINIKRNYVFIVTKDNYIHILKMLQKEIIFFNKKFNRPLAIL